MFARILARRLINVNRPLTNQIIKRNFTVKERVKNEFNDFKRIYKEDKFELFIMGYTGIGTVTALSTYTCSSYAIITDNNSIIERLLFLTMILPITSIGVGICWLPALSLYGIDRIRGIDSTF